MPGDHTDFAAYLAARWPSLVRALILLGCDRREAEEVARTGVARCYGDWERVRRGDDVDAYVYGVVLARLHRHRRRVPQPPPEPLPDEPTDDELLREALVAQLERTDPDERESLVLRFVAELDEAQVADARDVSLESAQARITHGLGRLDIHASPAETFRRAGESIEVPTTPFDDVVAEARTQRRRRWRIAGVATVAAAVVIGALTWVTTREPTPEELAPAPVKREKNPVRVAWYASGQLHLDNVVVTVPALTDLVELNGGVVYGDTEGTVAFVAVDGARRKIGDKSTTTPLVASSSDGWVAWVDPGSDEGQPPALVVYDVSNGTLLDAKGVSPDAVAISIDQHQVFYTDSEGGYAWTPGVEQPVPLDRDGLLDVESANRVYQLAPRVIEIEQSFFNVSFARRGTGAQLSDAGILVLSKAPGPGVAEGRPFTPLLYDARSGERKPSGLGSPERAVDATFGRNNTAVYLVAQVSDLAGGSDLDGNVDPLLVLRTCDLTSAQCTDVAPVPSGTDRPVLAH